ncbi:MAG TPA: murein transglycosylase domain-containing protein [Gallionella sp.]|nr:murein transglycosylase domain-containing protein [Gallionella sp.]
MKKFLIALPVLFLLPSCASQKGSSVNLDELIKAANSASAKNITKIASSSDPEATAKAMLEHKRKQWERDPMQLAQDLKVAKRDFDRLMNGLSGNVKKTWGKNETRLPERKTYVKYSKQYRSRAIVDFERGEIRVETLDQNADASLKNAIVTTLLTPEDPASVDVFSDSPVNLNGKSTPFLLGLVLNDAGQEIKTMESASSFADQMLAQTSTRTIQTDSGDKSVRYVVIRMVANFEDQKAQRYLQAVRKYAKQYNVSPSLVLGVIRTESSFNPHAVSGAPAYGLMQLVPTSGGREAYRRARNQDIAPSRDYLFDPENNIELGAAYLSVLTYDQLDGVDDRMSRDYCVISAYNTGPGNVMRAFTDANGKQRFEDGLQRINRLSPPQVYQILREKLPFEETRNYLPTVNANRKRYYSVDKTIVAEDSKPAAFLP